MDNPGTVQQLLDLEKAKPILRQWAEANPHIGELRIFGSYAKGAARHDSDLDVAVRVVKKKSGDTTVWVTALCECPVWGEELSRVLRVKVDMQDITGEHVSQYVQDGSILVYQDGAKAICRNEPSSTIAKKYEGSCGDGREIQEPNAPGEAERPGGSVTLGSTSS